MRKRGEGPIKLLPQNRGSAAQKPKEKEPELAEYIERFILYCKSEDMSPQTYNNYQCLLDKFNWWYTEYAHLSEKVGPHPRELTEDHIREYLLYLRSEQTFRWGEPVKKGKEKLSPTTVFNYGRAVRTFFNWLRKRHIIEVSPFSGDVSLVSRKDGVRKRHYNNLSDSDLELIFKALRRPEKLKKYNGARNFAMLALMLDSGMRMGELLSIRMCDIEWERKRVTIRGKTGERVCFYNRFVQDAMDNYYYTFRRKQEDYLHPNDKFWLTSRNSVFSEGGFWHMIEDTCNESGVRFHAHQFRHTFASILAKRVNLFELKELLGHKDINVTMIYTHGSPDANQQAHVGNSPLSVLGFTQKVNTKSKSKSNSKRGRPRKEI